jgi:hypothetical protein
MRPVDPRSRKLPRATTITTSTSGGGMAPPPGEPSMDEARIARA